MKKITALLLSILITAVLAAPAARAQDEPVAVLSMQSSQALLDGVESIARWTTPAALASQEQQDQAVQMARGTIEPFLANFKPDTPMGLAVWLSPEGTPDVLAFLPTDDARQLVAGLGNFMRSEPAGDSLKLQPPIGPAVFLKTRADWTYIALSQDRLATVPAEPDQLLGNLPQYFDLAARVNPQAVPAELQQLLLDQAAAAVRSQFERPQMEFEEGPFPPEGGAEPFPFDAPEGEEEMEEEAEGDPFGAAGAQEEGAEDPAEADIFAPGQEDPAEADIFAPGAEGEEMPEDVLGGLAPPGAAPDAALQAAIEKQKAAIRKFFAETDQVVFGLTVDQDAQELRLEFAHKPVADTPSAIQYQALRDYRSTRFAGFYQSQAGVQAHANMRLTAETAAAWAAQVDEIINSMLQAGAEGEVAEGEAPEGEAAEAPSAAELEIAKRLLSVVKEFFHEGDVDAVASLSTAGTPHLLAAGKVANPANVLTVINVAELASAAESVPGATARQETVAGVPLVVWKVEIPDGPEAALLQQLLGPELEVAAGVRDDNAYLAAGAPGVTQELAKAIGQSTRPDYKSHLPASLNVDAQKLVANLPAEITADFGQFVEQLAQAGVPLQLRFSTVPIKHGGVYRIRIGAGVFALLPRAAAGEAEMPLDVPPGGDDIFGAPPGAQPAADPGADAFDGADLFGDDAPAQEPPGAVPQGGDAPAPDAPADAPAPQPADDPFGGAGLEGDPFADDAVEAEAP